MIEVKHLYKSFEDRDVLKDINTVFVKYGIGRALWNYKEKDFGITDPHLADIRDEMEKYL